VVVHAPLTAVLSLAQGAEAGGQSTVLTLLGLAEPFRKRFAATPEAKARKLTARHFSAASPGGRCEACEGRGILTVAMDLLPDVTVGCEVCGGKRFQEEVLACRVHGRNIAEVMDATVAEALQGWAKERFLAEPLAAVRDLGLGYLRLGQEARTLSAGEFQRLRLAGILATAPQGRTALLLDEPARGLGFEEVERLAEALRRLARAGHLVVVVEHDLELIAAADWVIDLGPEGGPGGGRLVAQGPPQAIVDVAASQTGRALAGHF
jgi:excinuclease ABC subunit A